MTTFDGLISSLGPKAASHKLSKVVVDSERCSMIAALTTKTAAAPMPQREYGVWDVDIVTVSADAGM